MNYKDYLTSYARLILKVGLNLQERQELYINSTYEASDLIEEIIRLAYEEFKSGKVHVRIDVDSITKANYLYGPSEVISEVDKEVVVSYEEQLNKNAARLFINCPNPTLLKGVDPTKIALVSQKISAAVKDIRDEMDRKSQTWCIVAYVSEAWAKAVFSDLSLAEAKEKLWEMVLKATRLTEADPLKAWEEHVRVTKKRADFLNASKIKTLHYKSSVTDFYIDMPKNYHFTGAGATANFGGLYVPNIPTEEIFATPLMYSARGHLASTMPLNLRGTLIKDFWFDFEDGKVVNYGASEGLETLKGLLETDEGAKRLGEVALIGVDSPISNLNALFYNTLFDENASCHFALGQGFGECVEGALTLDSAAQEALGINQSLIHVDFMVGSKDLNITATLEDGSELVIFKDGNFDEAI